MPRLLGASPRYLAGREQPRAIRDLAGWDYIQLSARPPEISLSPPGNKAAQSLAFESRVALDSATAVRAMVVAGLGLASLPELLVRADIAHGRVVEVLPGWRLPLLNVYAVWPSSTARPGLTLRFVDFIAPRVAALFGGVKLAAG